MMKVSGAVRPRFPLEQAEADARAGRGLHRSQVAALRAEHAGGSRINVHPDDGSRRGVHHGEFQFSRAVQGGADAGGWRWFCHETSRMCWRICLRPMESGPRPSCMQ